MWQFTCSGVQSSLYTVPNLWLSWSATELRDSRNSWGNPKQSWAALQQPSNSMCTICRVHVHVCIIYGYILLYFQTPILSPSPSHTLTKSLAPITSTPTQLHAPHRSTCIPTAPSNVQRPPHSHILPSSLPTPHHTEHPLTSTPILPPSSPNPPHNMAAILEQEMEEEKVDRCSIKAPSSLHRAGLSETSGVGSTMERLLDFDVSDHIKYRAR